MKGSWIKFSLAGLFALGLLAWWWLRPDPLEVFRGQVVEMVTEANEGRHGALAEKFSPEAAKYVADQFLPLPQALVTARKLDADQKAFYRLEDVPLFVEGEYAEALIKRGRKGSEREQDLLVPFVYRDGKWLVAKELRDGENLRNPYR